RLDDLALHQQRGNRLAVTERLAMWRMSGGPGRRFRSRGNRLIRLERIGALALLATRFAMARSVWRASFIALAARVRGGVRRGRAPGLRRVARRTGRPFASLGACGAFRLVETGSREIESLGTHDIDFLFQQPLDVGEIAL